MLKNIFLLSLILTSSAYACDQQQAIDVVKASLNELAKAYDYKSITLSSPTADFKDEGNRTFLFRLINRSGKGPMGMIGFDNKKCEVTGTLMLPLVGEFQVK